MRIPLVLSLLLPTLLVAQSNTTGALQGTVKGTDGKNLAGADVRLSSPALLGGERRTQASPNGSFRFPALPPGLYKISVQAEGYTSRTESERVELGRSSTLNLRLAPVAMATVEVTAAATTAESSPAPTGLSQNFKADTLAQLPTASRSLSDLLNLTPGANRGSAWGGAGSGSNAYLMDGINVGDTSGGTQWIYTNMDWFDEVQVGGLGAAAEFGGFSGAFINTVVKRGGNAFEGVLSGYYDSTAWQAHSSNRDWAWTREDLQVPEASNHDLSLSVGGALVKDRLWYFISAQRERNSTTFAGSLATGPLPSRKVESTRLLGKLSWQALSTATLEGMFEYDTRDIDHKYVNQSWGLYEAAASGRQSSPSRYYSLNWTQTLGSSLVLTLKANGYNGSYDILPEHGETNCLDIDGDKFFNNLDIAERNRRSRASFAATLDFFRSGLLSAADSHAFRFGIEREQGTSESEAWNPGGFILTADTDEIVDGRQTYYPYGAYTLGVEKVRVRSNRMVVFAQDTWTLSPRFSLRPGLRFEQDRMNPMGGSELWKTSTVAPRFGGTLGLTADQKHVLKFHWGRFYDGIEAGYISRSIPGAVAPLKRWWWNDGPFTDLRNPPMTEGLEFRDARTSFSNLDPQAKLPFADETTLAYEMALNPSWTASLSGVHRKWKDMLVRVDRQEQAKGGYQIYDPVAKSFLAFYDITNVGKEDYYITNDERAQRAYSALTLSLERKMEANWSFSASYTRAKSSGNVSSLRGGASTFENLNNQINADGLLAGFSDHELKLRGSYEWPGIKTRLSGSFVYLSGEHWTRTLAVNDTKSSGAKMIWSGSLYAEARGSQTLPAQKLLNLRVAQPFSLGQKLKAEFYLEVFNLLNDCATLDLNTRTNANRLVNKVDDTLYADYRKPSLTETPRRLRLGFRLSF